eukprot:jgi/Chrzof1/3969/Cz13g15130.t1
MATFVCLMAWKVRVHEVQDASVHVMTAAGSGPEDTGADTWSVGDNNSHSSEHNNGVQVVNSAPVMVSRGLQTVGGPTLYELKELLKGFRALILAENLSVRPCTATVNLLQFFLLQEVLAWNPAVLGIE